ncbi:MAG: DinB family protein [candidate division Zixibacteria bacterium]|nr:DinB family protein [candidate division Zixibacteria bacterium]
MTEVEHIYRQLERTFCSDRWLFPAVRDSLAGVSAAAAAVRPVARAHTIWEIVAHMTRWERAVLRMLKGESLDRTYDPGNAWDWPPITQTTNDAWSETVQELEEAHKELLAAAEGLDKSRLEDRLSGENFTVGELLHAAIEHDHYHSGQIALLKKAAAPPRA